MGSTMTPAALAKIKLEISQLRGSSRKSVQLERVAERLGRKLATRGKHPTWQNGEFPGLISLSIPHHSRDLPRKTVEDILDHLINNDVLAWDQRLEPDILDASTIISIIN